MSSALDMSLDELIKKNKGSDGGAPVRGNRGGGGGGRGWAGGPIRRFPNRATGRAIPYSAWDPKLEYARNAQPLALTLGEMGTETGTKLYISNLDYGVSNEDIKELFSEVGELKRYSINYDRSGRSKGTAEVVFLWPGDARAAVKRYNNVQLDGKPMKIEIIGTNLETSAVAPVAFSQMFGIFNSAPRSEPGRPGPTRWVQLGPGAVGHGHGRGQWRGRGRSFGHGRGRGDQVSSADLDAELDSYHAEAMQTS